MITGGARKAKGKMEIKNRYTGKVIYTTDKDSLSGANLSGAYLSGANLSEADLYGANLSEANLSGATFPDGRSFADHLKVSP